MYTAPLCPAGLGSAAMHCVVIFTKTRTAPQDSSPARAESKRRKRRVDRVGRGGFFLSGFGSSPSHLEKRRPCETAGILR